MRTLIVIGLVASLISLYPPAVSAQRRPVEPRVPEPRATEPTPEAAEITLDDTTKLKAAALEAQLSASIANFALLQRQAQEIQTEWNRLIEERKKLLQEAGRRANVEVKDMAEWGWDKTAQKYVRVRRTP